MRGLVGAILILAASVLWGAGTVAVALKDDDVAAFSMVPAIAVAQLALFVILGRDTPERP